MASNSAWVACLGLGKQSIAPSSIALIEISAPFWVSVESMMTGMGLVAISSARKSMPFMPGISMSSVMMSGLSFGIISRASSALAALSRTMMSPDFSSAAVNRARMVTESSTIRTRVFSAMGDLFLVWP